MDIMLILMQLSIEGTLVYLVVDANSQEKKVRIVFLAQLLPSFLEIAFSLLLVISACYITSWLKKSTGKKQNTCLLTWHIVNLFILTIVIAMDAILDEKTYSFHEDDKNYWKYLYYYNVSALIQLNV